VKINLRGYGSLALFLLGAWLVFDYALSYILPFILALILAEVIDAPSTWLTRRLPIPRGVAVGLVLVGVLAFTILLTVVGAAQIIGELTQFSDYLPDIYDQVRVTVEGLTSRLTQFAAGLPQEVTNLVETQLETVYERAGEWVELLLTALRDFTFNRLPNFLTVLLIAVISSYFLARDKEVIGQATLRLLPAPWREGVMRAQSELYRATLGMINAQLIIVLVDLVITVTALYLLGTRYAVSIAIAAAILDIIPYGPGLIFAPWSLYHLLVGNVMYGVFIIIVFGGISLVRTVIQANVIGVRIGVHPFATLLALYIGARVFGATGLIIGPVIAVLLKAAIVSGLLQLNHQEG